MQTMSRSIRCVQKPILIAGAMTLAQTGAKAAVPAFPGATGPGATATGGRGGDVYHVTNLNPDLAGTVPGSFTYGVRNVPSAGRTIVFDVAGTIYSPGGTTNDDTVRFNNGNITVAGQTAPSPGITIAGAGSKWTGTNVILRNIADRPNVSAKPDTVTYDSFSLQVQSSIVDHVSATWFTDEGISETDAGANSTVQYAVIGDGLNYNGHAFGSIISTEHPTTEYSYNHNLYAELTTRIPAVGSETLADGTQPIATTEWSNNVISNWAQTKAGYGSAGQLSHDNFFGNYYINNKPPHPTTNLFRGDTGHSMYASGNFYGEASANGTITGAHVIADNSSSYFGPETFVTQPWAVTGVDSNTRDTADVALQRVTDYSGANWQNRSVIDQAIIDKIGLSTANQINDLTGSPQAAQWATLMSQRPDASGNAPFSRPANYDTDRDGMPDTWEIAHGLNANSATGVNGNNGSVQNDGYTNLEAYINELGAFPASGALVFGNANGTGRFAEIGNWGNLWEPSRFDAAQVNTGTATVDVVGQHARTLAVAANSGNTAALSVTGGWIDLADSLQVGPGGTGSVTQSGGIVHSVNSVVIGGANNAGTYTMTGGTLATPLLTKGTKGGSFNFTGGTLHADTINFSLTNNGGTIAPGSDLQLQQIAAASMPDINGSVEAIQSLIGSTHVVGGLTLQSGSTQIDLASLASFDKLTIDGTLQLGGALNVILDNGYSPSPGNSWLIASAANITGNFSSITPGFTAQTSGANLFLLVTPVPEPASMLMMLAALGLLKRNRRTIAAAAGRLAATGRAIACVPSRALSPPPVLRGEG
jgi:hypothetical protein